jgi:hypothetical protein
VTNTPYGSNPVQPDPNYTDPTYVDPNYTDPNYPTTDYTAPADPTGYAGTESQPVYSAPVEPAGSYAPADQSFTSGDSSTKDVAKGEAANVKNTAVDAGKNVAGTAKQEAANVAAEAGYQAKSLLGSATSEIRSQAGTQQGRLASTLRSYSDELHGLVDGTPQAGGPLTDLAHQAAEKGSEIARWLEDREPADVLEEVRRFARRRPAAFLGLCALAGVLAGRVTRGAVAANTSVDSPTPSRALTDRSSTDVVAPSGSDFYAAPAGGFEASPAPEYQTGTSTYGAYTDQAATDQPYTDQPYAADQPSSGGPNR